MKKLFVCILTVSILGITTPNAMPLASAVDTDTELLQGSTEEIKAEELPEAVQKTINDDYSSWPVSKTYKVTKSDGSVYYSVEFETGGTQPTVVNFDEDGKVMEG